MLSIIAAVAKNGVIGSGNAIPWQLSEDLENFQKLTTGHPVIMGRKTWESLKQPLPNRTNIVITHNKKYAINGAIITYSIEEALEAARHTPGSEEIFIIGGAEIYRQAFPFVDRLYITDVDIVSEGNVLFPPLSGKWRKISYEKGTSLTGLSYAFVVYERIKDLS